ncbi:DNAase [Parazoarcus communis]|uniref:DNAase n=1 Tax=Parazoarcus communis TaxID=41977 RepID=A0A2U8H4U0_9RHOO|nr:TatD family hydrolase [Parazoarcus communis]AWI80952.1 DNAase [Parazoarcus communis]
MLIDTHIHLDASEFDGNREKVLIDARAAGVGAFVVPAVDRESFRRVAALASANRDIHPALGIHPLYTGEATQADLELLEYELGREKCVAVGEIGLDHFVEDVDREQQLLFFVAQLRIAQRYKLPVILHLRRAQDAVLKQLRLHAVCGGIAHAFNGSRQQADAFIKLGFKLGFGGAMSFEGSQRIRRLATELPLESIVLETDAPDMAPAWGQGLPNVPANIARYARILADLRGLPVEEVIRATSVNARAALPGLDVSSAAV